MTYHDDNTNETVPFGNSSKVIEASTSSSHGGSLKKVFVIAATMMVGAAAATTYSGTGGNIAGVLFSGGHCQYQNTQRSCSVAGCGEGRVGNKYLNPKCAGSQMFGDLQPPDTPGAKSILTRRTLCDGQAIWSFEWLDYHHTRPSYSLEEFCNTCAGGRVWDSTFRQSHTMFQCHAYGG